MLHFLLHALKAVWRERIALFWPFWVTTTVVGAMLVIWVIPKRKSVPQVPNPIPSRQLDGSRAAWLAVAFLVLFLACYIAGSLVWEDFAYYDNSMFTTQTLAGQNIVPGIWPEQGRFFPLAHQEYNLLRHVTRSVIGYHSLRIVLLTLLCGILLVFDEQLSIQARVALIAVALITPGILISFNGLIYPESNVIFWLICFAWSVKRFEQTGSKAWAVAAMISTQFMLYYKETAPLLLVGFTVGRLLLRCWKLDRTGWDFRRLRDRESRLDMCLALMVAPFFLFYLAAMYPNYRTNYADIFRIPLGQAVSSYFKLDLAVWVLVAVVSARIVLVLRHKIAPSLFWDGLALGGVAYIAGFLYLRMYAAYYLAPADLIAVLYLGRLAFLSVGKMGLAARLCVLALVSLIVLQDISCSAFRMYERKNVIHAKAEMGRLIKARYDSDPRNMRLFFPSAKPYWIMEFAAYLSYIGVPMDRGADSPATSSVQLAGRNIPENARCIGYVSFLCHPADRPEPGDLIVVLPDDFAYVGEFNSLAHGGSEPILTYAPRPAIAQWLRPYVNRLHGVSPTFPYTALPEHWLEASVTIAK